MTVIKLIQVISIIDIFSAKNNHGKYLWTKKNVLSLIRFIYLDQIHKIKIYHMVVSEHSEVIEGRQRLIATDILDPEQEAEGVSIDYYVDASDEEDDSVSGEASVRTDVTEVGTKEVKEVQQAVKYYYLLSYILKPTLLATTGIER